MDEGWPVCVRGENIFVKLLGNGGQTFYNVLMKSTERFFANDNKNVFNKHLMMSFVILKIQLVQKFSSVRKCYITCVYIEDKPKS